MQTQASDFHLRNQPGFGQVDALILEEVGFKWLMTGHGWWIDTTRLHTDSAYAAELLQLAKTSNSIALHECADRLHNWKTNPS
jgi:hypothetical protein